MRKLVVALAFALAAASPALAQSDMSIVKGVSPEVRTSKLPGPEAFGFVAPQGRFGRAWRRVGTRVTRGRS